MRSLRFAVGIAAAASLLAPPVSAQDVAGVGTFKEALSMESVGGVAISPDGATVAYTVRRTVWEENGYDSEIWIAPTQGPPYQLTRTTDGSSGSPSWSPDGRWLAFTANRGEHGQVHLISPRGGEAFAVTEVEQGVSGYAWSPDGTRLLLLVPEPRPDDMETRAELYGDFAFDDETGIGSHLWVVQVAATGESHRSYWCGHLGFCYLAYIRNSPV